MIAAAPTHLLQPELRFDPVEHRYFWRGEQLPSVTQMIGELGLIAGGEWFTEASAERGDNAHKTTRYHDEGRLDWDTLPDEMAGYLAAWIDFCAEHKFKPEHCEFPLASEELRFAGTIDRAGYMGEVYALPDIKTMKQPIKKQKPWWAIQLSLYKRLIEESGMYWVGEIRTLNVILCPDGRYRIPAKAMSDEESDACAEAVLKLYKLKGMK